MRIFMLVQHPGARGPVPKHTAHLVKALRFLGCTVVTHLWGQHRVDESVVGKLIQRPRDVLSVARVLQDEAFDIAVIKTAHDWRTLLRDIAVSIVIRRRCRPIVLQLHGSAVSTLLKPGHHAFKATTAILLALTDGIMVLSTEEQRQWNVFCRQYPIFSVKNPYVSVFLPASRRMRHAPVLRERVLFVGRLIEEKGVFDLVDALADVLEYTECDLVLVGEGPRERDLRDRIDRLGLNDHVTLAGYLKGSDLAERYLDATIFVLPTSWNEGFPTVLSEAMDAGLPIVTTPIRGAADHLVPGENALFVEPGDVKGLASAIQRLLGDGELRARMAGANRERIRMFDPRVVAAEYLEVLHTLVRRTSQNDGDVRPNEVSTT
jgi:glycosyltransferase involved in cell wall biosynthesis